jgi:hypothetical protein
MSTVTLYTLSRTLVEDLAHLESGGTAFFFLNPDTGYCQIMLSSSEYALSGGGSPSVVRVRKRPVS